MRTILIHCARLSNYQFHVIFLTNDVNAFQLLFGKILTYFPDFYITLADFDNIIIDSYNHNFVLKVNRTQHFCLNVDNDRSNK